MTLPNGDHDLLNERTALCKCGCGKPAPVASRTNARHGYVKGQQVTFIKGHSRRGVVHSEASKRKMSQNRLGKGGRKGEANSMWAGENVGYKCLHKWLDRNFPKLGVCEECGAPDPTEYANVSGKYHRSRDDFRELCRSCHARFDDIVLNFAGAR